MLWKDLRLFLSLAMVRVTSSKGSSSGLKKTPLFQVTRECPGAHQVDRVELGGGRFAPGQVRLPER